MVENDEKIWKKFLRKHWQMLVLFIAIAIAASIGAILVYLQFVTDAQLSGLVPSTLGLWSMGHFVTFLLHLIFWEIIFIGVPVIILIAVIYFLWWKNLPDAEREEYRRGHLFFGDRSHRSDGSQAISFLIFIVFAIKIFYDGNWGEPFANWTFDYLVQSCLWALFWVVIIFGIPILIGGTWWLRREMKKEP